jgi:hypothetical protein
MLAPNSELSQIYDDMQNKQNYYSAAHDFQNVTPQNPQAAAIPSC